MLQKIKVLQTITVSKLELLLESHVMGILINFILIPLLILSALLLPPISLAERILLLDYESIGTSGGTIQTEDGAKITLAPSSPTGTIRIKGGMSNIVQNCGRPDYLAGIGIFLKFKLRMTA